MSEQSFKSHAQLVRPYHYFLLPALLLGIIGSFVNLYLSIGDSSRLYNASLIALLMITAGMTAIFARVFALRAQDRAIRAEENLRHYVLTGKLLDRRLTMRQIIGLRFASDAEFPGLAEQAASSAMSEKDIKARVKDWRADRYRV